MRRRSAPKAELLLRERHQVDRAAFAELTIWRVPEPVEGSAHTIKDRLAYVVRSRCVVRCHNEALKGDHRHVGAAETPYRFVDVSRLLADFWAEVDRWRPE